MTPEERAYFALAQHIGLEGNLIGGLTKEMERRVAEQIRAAIAEEREACASLATEFCVGVHDGGCPACDAATAIRARA